MPQFRCDLGIRGTLGAPQEDIVRAQAVARHLVPDGYVTEPQERPGERRVAYCDRRVIRGGKYHGESG
jgi:hypothetical protein